MMRIDTICGVPVHYSSEAGVARAIGLWPRKRILVGPLWFALPPSERQAVLYHEAKHCLAFHMEIRLLLVPLCWLGSVRRLAQRQELAADRHAADNGYGMEMLRFVRRMQDVDDEFYPSVHDRCAHLSRYLRESIHGLAA